MENSVWMHVTVHSFVQLLFHLALGRTVLSALQHKGLYQDLEKKAILLNSWISYLAIKKIFSYYPLNRNIKLPFSTVYPEQLCENELNTQLTHT